MKKFMSILAGAILTLSLTACHHKASPNTISVGTISGPETTLMEVAQKVALQRYGLHVKIVAFSDYALPNAAVNDGSIDANMFQHVPFLQAQIKDHGYQLVVVGKTFIYPMAIYSKQYKTLTALPKGAKVAVPNDPSNEARALLLLQKAGLITLRKGVGFNATVLDVSKNSDHLNIIPLQAAQLVRSLGDVSIAVINTNYAVPAGLSPAKNALFVESANSPYANVVVTREQNKANKKVRELVEALHSKEVLAAAKRIFGEGAIPAWPAAKTTE